MRNNRQHFFWSSIILVFVFAGAGCIKSSSNSVNTSAVCYVSIMNEAPYGSAVDIYFNGTLVSASGDFARRIFFCIRVSEAGKLHGRFQSDGNG